MKAVLQFHLSRAQESALRSALPDWVDLRIEEGRSRSDLGDADVLLHVLKPVTEAIIEQAPRLRFIQKIGVGLNTIDLDAARARNVRVSNMPGTNSQAVCEHTLMLMLSVLRKVRQLDAEVRAGAGWDLRPEFFDSVGELAGRVIGFLGFGEVPRRLQPVLTCLGAQVKFSMSSRQSTADAQACTLESLLRQADVVSLHLPLTNTTQGILNRGALQLMKRGAILINTGRGELVSQEALVDALAAGHLGGAGLDVMASEPLPPGDPLLQLPNVVLTPHVAWLTPETLRRSFGLIGENLQRLRRGEALINEVRFSA